MSLTVTEEQANFILGEYLKLHATTVGMHEKVHKTFAVDGRMLGDIGECVLSYAFNLKLKEKQVAGFDAETARGDKVEIKTRTNKAHVDISEATLKRAGEGDCYLLVAEINRDKREIKIVINAVLQPRIAQERKGGFMKRSELARYCGTQKLNLVHNKIGEWSILV